MRKKLLFVFGTRPEAIKMCPLIREFEKDGSNDVSVCVTGQHRTLTDQVLMLFGISPGYDLDIMKKGQTLDDITDYVLRGVGKVIDTVAPDLVFVHGDTTTAFASSLASFYRKVPLAHVEAGLRTYDMYAPYPEEFNRRAAALMAKYHFAPTAEAAKNLIREGTDADRVFVTGNTVVDALAYTYDADYKSAVLEKCGGRKLVMLTAHRRESRGEKMRGIFSAVRKIADERNDVMFVCPLHPADEVRKAALPVYGSENIYVCEPLGLYDFHNLLARSYIAVSDSGGIQEEAISFGIPVLVTRDKTERPEGIGAGGLKLVGCDSEKLYEQLNIMLDRKDVRDSMRSKYNPYGDGRASRRIVGIVNSII